MLILDRKKLQQIKIGDDITLTILKIKRQEVHFVIEAPDNIVNKLVAQATLEKFSKKSNQYFITKGE